MVTLYADGADLDEMHVMAKNKAIRGFTTNPTLMRKAGVRNYRAFAERVLNSFPDYPVSFEVFSDDFDKMEKQAREIASWGNNIYVKIPVVNTQGFSTRTVIVPPRSPRL